METKVVDFKNNYSCIQPLYDNRILSDKDWIEIHGSGTLRKNKRLGMAWKAQYLEERVAYEFGWEFEIQPRSRIMFGDAYTEGDESAVTEAGWHIERYFTRKVFQEDIFQCKYINVEYSWGEKKEGIGIIVKETSAPWIPKGNIVFAIVAEYDTVNEKWKAANNPF
jgi:hypothetical protein